MKTKMILTMLAVPALAATVALPIHAQSSARYKLEEHVTNAGGHPDNGSYMSSASYRIRLDSIGEVPVRSGMGSPSYGMDAGFVSAYPPPGEVPSMWYSDHDTMHWSAERSAGSYNLYRDQMSNISGGGYGECHDSGIAGTTTSDTGIPIAGDGWFYLVTSANRLGEEGIKGVDSDGTEREGNVCP